MSEIAEFTRHLGNYLPATDVALVARAFGIYPIHFGVILILNGGIGLITPPVGSVLFVGSAIGQISITQTLRSIWPLYLAAFAVLMLVTYVPALTLWLPAVLK